MFCIKQQMLFNIEDQLFQILFFFSLFMQQDSEFQKSYIKGI